MLTSSFVENSNTALLLKYCYANWVLFKDHDDPHASVNRPGKGWSAWSGGEWDWMSFNKPADDTNPCSHVVCVPSQTRQPHIPDPHPHPTPQPPPAPALSIWSIAHRYSMPGLIALAPKHMIEYDYVVDQWDMVCESEEFERCCQEMAMGDCTFEACFLPHWLRWSISPDQAFKASRISTPNIVMLLRDSNATVQSNGELPLVKLSEQGTVLHNGMGSNFQPLERVKGNWLSELYWWSLRVCTMEYWHWSSFQNEVYEKRMHYIMKFSVNPKRPDTITTGGITIGIGAVT
ncbi:hypothetical protein BU17DRAFT_64992 [Hysterangium stoloniferum]|nr:hypothetical protein BU17DRAFT_64992 [Hysterangium stoloniferum]